MSGPGTGAVEPSRDGDGAAGARHFADLAIQPKQPEASVTRPRKSASAISGRLGSALCSGTLSTAMPALPERTRHKASSRPSICTILSTTARPGAAGSAAGTAAASPGASFAPQPCGGGSRAAIGSKELETGVAAAPSAAAITKVFTAHPPVCSLPTKASLVRNCGGKMPQGQAGADNQGGILRQF